MADKPVVAVEFIHYEVDVRDEPGTALRRERAEMRLLELMAQGFTRLDTTVGQPNRDGQYAIVITMVLIEEV